MKVFRIDHSEGFSKGRTDLDSIENILKQTNHELGDIEKKNKELLQISISDFWHFLSPNIGNIWHKENI